MNKVCIVEPDKTWAYEIRRKLSVLNCECIIINEFDKVDMYIKQYSPDLVLMDVILPAMSGYYWCSKIHKVSTIPIIFLSEDDDGINPNIVRSMGGAGFITKTFRSPSLQQTVLKFLRNQ